MKKGLIIGIVIMVIVVVILIIINLNMLGTPEERREAERMKKLAENSAIMLNEQMELHEKTNQKVNYIITNFK